MKRTAVLFLLFAALGGCASSDYKSCRTCGGGEGVIPATVGGVQGAWGQPVLVNPGYSGSAAELDKVMKGQQAPRQIVQSYPSAKPKSQSGMIQTADWTDSGTKATLVPAGYGCMNGNCPADLMTSTGAPRVKGCIPPGAVAAAGALTPDMARRFPTQRTSVRFTSPERMKVSWYTASAEGTGGTGMNELHVPGRYNFAQAAIYRLKLSNIPKLPGVDLYPTLEVVPANARSETFLAHSAVPVSFTDEDFDQIASGNYVVKVIYLPDPQFQDLATVGIGEIVSSRLEAGADPIAEAGRRGSILLIVRIGNIDLEAQNTPGMDVPSPHMMQGSMHGGAPHMMQGSMPGGAMGAPGAMMMGQPSAKMGDITNNPSADSHVSGDGPSEIVEPAKPGSMFRKSLFQK